MEFLVFLIMVVAFVMVSFSKKATQRPADSGNNTNTSAHRMNKTQAGAVMDEDRKATQGKRPRNGAPRSQAAFAQPQAIGMAGPAEAAEGASLLEDEECHGGSMEHVHSEGLSDLEDEECFGGSMEHNHDEGVSRTAHARRMAAMDGQREDGSGNRALLIPETIDARTLRQSVVMAEVLGRPRALRGRIGRAG